MALKAPVRWLSFASSQDGAAEGVRCPSRPLPPSASLRRKEPHAALRPSSREALGGGCSIRRPCEPRGLVGRSGRRRMCCYPPSVSGLCRLWAPNRVTSDWGPWRRRGTGRCVERRPAGTRPRLGKGGTGLWRLRWHWSDGSRGRGAVGTLEVADGCADVVADGLQLAAVLDGWGDAVPPGM